MERVSGRWRNERLTLTLTEDRDHFAQVSFSECAVTSQFQTSIICRKSALSGSSHHLVRHEWTKRQSNAKNCQCVLCVRTQTIVDTTPTCAPDIVHTSSKAGRLGRSMWGPRGVQVCLLQIIRKPYELSVQQTIIIILQKSHA